MQHEPMNIDEESEDRSFEIVYVRSVSGESKLTVKLIYRDPVSGTREFNFLREKAEAWGKFSQRIANNIRNGPGKKKKKGKNPKKGDKLNEGGDGDDSLQTKITILTPTSNPIDSAMCTDEALQSNNLLCIGDLKYRVQRNSPTISNLRIPKSLLLNCHIVAEVDVEFCEKGNCKFEWFVSASSDSAPDVTNRNWVSVSKDSSVVFTDLGHIGKWLKVVAFPCDSSGVICGLEKVIVSKKTIESGPTLLTPIRLRHRFTETRAGDRILRVVSYNILADFYADSDHSRNYLYPYCSPECLDSDYRRQLMLWELQGYNADVICLQEVDEKLYSRYLQPVLCVDGGFESLLLLKRQCSEGIAVFYRRDKLEFVEDCSISSLTEALYDMVDEPEMSQVVEGVKNNEKFNTRWRNLRQGLLSLVLRWRGNCNIEPQLVIVASSHFYFHPNADHMRLLQAVISLKHLSRVKRRFGQQCGVILAGDFNTDPRNAMCEVTSSGKLRTTVSDWYSCGREEYFGSPELSFDITLLSAYNLKEIEVTNYVAGYRGILDYIFYDADVLLLSRAISFPSMEEITAKIALPNEYFPSDHLALVAELSLR